MTEAVSSAAEQDACPSSLGWVSLTYDDALPTHLTQAAPALTARGLVGTFFLIDVAKDPAPWAALLADGHELGSHTLLHPCPQDSWVVPGNASQDYDLERMRRELDASIEQLRALGAKSPLSFAYPCGVTWVTSPAQSYVPLVEERFVAARGVTSALVTRLDQPYLVPAYFSPVGAAVLKHIVDNASEARGWVVFGFHGVGGDHSPVPLEVHEQLLDYLAREKARVRVMTFGQAVACWKARAQAG